MEPLPDQAGRTPARGAEIAAAPEPELALIEASRREERRQRTIRLAGALRFGTTAWVFGLVIDWLCVRWTFPGVSLALCAALRLAAVPPALGLLGRLGRAPPLSERALTVCEALPYLLPALAGGVLAALFGGAHSVYNLNPILLIMAHGVGLPQAWRRAIWGTVLYPLLHLAVLLGAGRVSPAVAAQLGDPAARAHLLIYVLCYAIACLAMLEGGHTMWELKQQVFSSRSLGRYRLASRLGAGGMGEVWRAFDRTLRRDVALKILASRGAADEAAVRRFEREVKATSELRHPNTVRLYDFGRTDDGLWYYAMELLEGETLRALVLREGPLAPERALHFGRQAARALAEAHGAGIVHRDLKPENLLVTTLGGEADFLKVIDFGVARLITAARADDAAPTLTEHGLIVGTPTFMAPEVAVGGPADARSDVYGLGAVLYLLLCGRPPFEGESAVAVLHAHLHEPPIAPSARRGAPIPEDLERVVLRCLAKAPAERYADGHALAEALTACASAGTWRPPSAPPALRRAAPDALENDATVKSTPVAGARDGGPGAGLGG